jgi:choline dehydrogenase-like flavoprotein
MTRKLDLRTGRPVWHAYRAPSVPTGKLFRDVKTDVAIVGMGISGAMIAEALTEAGHSVVCIDRRGPLLGSTAATTALVQFEIDQPLSVLSRQIGRQYAERVLPAYTPPICQRLRCAKNSASSATARCSAMIIWRSTREN